LAAPTCAVDAVLQVNIERGAAQTLMSTTEGSAASCSLEMSMLAFPQWTVSARALLLIPISRHTGAVRQVEQLSKNSVIALRLCCTYNEIAMDSGVKLRCEMAASHTVHTWAAKAGRGCHDDSWLLPVLQVKAVSRDEAGSWELEYEAGKDGETSTNTHSAVLLADVMTVRQGTAHVYTMLVHHHLKKVVVHDVAD